MRGLEQPYPNTSRRLFESRFSVPASRIPTTGSPLSAVPVSPCVREVWGHACPVRCSTTLPGTVPGPPPLKSYIICFQPLTCSTVPCVLRELYQAKSHTGCVCAEELGHGSLSPTAVGEQGVTVLAQPCWLWASGRAFKKCELEEKCPISRATRALCVRREVGGGIPERALPTCRFLGKQKAGSAERSQCGPGRGDFRQVS